MVVVPESAAAPRIEHTERNAEVFHELWEAYQRRHPGYKDRFGRRNAVMKTIGARFLDPRRLPVHTAARAAPETPVPTTQQMVAAVLYMTGELRLSDPCPCKSGRKYEDCCGI